MTYVGVRIQLDEAGDSVARETPVAAAVRPPGRVDSDPHLYLTLRRLRPPPSA